jgi:hypothetical protein
MGKQQANYRLDESLLEALKDRSNLEGISTTDIVTKALQQYLGVVYQDAIQADIQPEISLDELVEQAVEKRLDAVLDQLREFELKLHSQQTYSLLYTSLSASVDSRFDELHNQIANIKTSETISPKKSKPLASIAA